jgi:ribosomal protein S18 acetylase RimI-like enzyme
MPASITVYYLEMHDPSALRPKGKERTGVEARRVEIPSVAFSRFLYEQVGDRWNWVRRRKWPDEQWQKHISRPEFHTWVLYDHGTPAGYFEFEQQAEQNVEIVQLGLMPQFIGQGLGALLVTTAVEKAWATGARRVWLHTCTEDHPHALANYQARGFRLYRQETKEPTRPE